MSIAVIALVVEPMAKIVSLIHRLGAADRAQAVPLGEGDRIAMHERDGEPGTRQSCTARATY